MTLLTLKGALRENAIASSPSCLPPSFSVSQACQLNLKKIDRGYWSRVNVLATVALRHPPQSSTLDMDPVFFMGGEVGSTFKST